VLYLTLFCYRMPFSLEHEKEIAERVRQFEKMLDALNIPLDATWKSVTTIVTCFFNLIGVRQGQKSKLISVI
jgi:hypothetical protein